MKIRESGMPDNNMWETFFSPCETLSKLRLDHSVSIAVDFGFGYGTFLIPASRIVTDKVIGFDIESEMFEHTEESAKNAGIENIELVLRDIVTQGTALSNESVDYVMLFNILHARHPELLLKEAFRILKPNGKAGITHWNYEAGTPRGPSMEIRPTSEHCVLWAEDIGFDIIDERINLPPHHYGVVAKKGE
ncbi:MAG: class I SAM-dependent methyltransferase [Kiritimatiellaeota bacterium]|nr:class I SAM-dependent methyltransferase [Kiritimatiellota bacterium]